MTKKTTTKGTDFLIRTIRMGVGLTTEKLAELAGVEYYAAHRAEIGRPIRPSTVYQIANVLNISPDIVFYSAGQLPKEIIELMRKDPISFKEKIDELCSESWRLTKTDDYIKNIKKKIEEIKEKEHQKSQHEMRKLLSHLKPTE